MSENNDVGYGKPPKQSQFKKGTSGNPKGRPKGRKNMSTLVADALAQKVPIKMNVRARNMPVQEALIQKLVQCALKGPMRETIAFMKYVEEFHPIATHPSNLPEQIEIVFIDSDGNGRPANKEKWQDWQHDSLDAQLATTEKGAEEKNTAPETE